MRRQLPLAIAAALAIAAVATTVVDLPALGVFLGLIAVPAALYAALTTRRAGILVALGAAATGVGVIVYWIYVWNSAVQGSS